MDETIGELLPRSGLAVLSVLGPDGYPVSSLIEFSARSDGKFVFDAALGSRKRSALLTNDRASLVIGWTDEQTLQVQGRARLIGMDADDRALEQAYAQCWPANHARSCGDGVFYILEAHWMQWSDFAQHPPTVREWRQHPANGTTLAPGMEVAS